ncbi:hypothetical protein GCM10011591_39530 [Nocardia camponoti]|uniref:Uncharacterized protein n=1 Tax=Nocardia camponoti TaxID=1616106 RepID=A0A917QQH7_9NOCA|nr:hypothetical protein GCM10011591_39530 [Nocardia camponoti]
MTKKPSSEGVSVLGIWPNFRESSESADLWVCGSQGSAMSCDSAFDGIAEVVPNLPPISDLDRVRCAFCGAFGVGTGLAAADDLDAGMCLQP